MIRALSLWLALAGTALAQDAAPAGPAPSDAIEQAFQKEYAYLVAERAALESRVRAFSDDAARRTADANARLDETQNALLALQRRAELLEQRLESAQRAQAGIIEGRGALDAALSQAQASLDLPAPPADASLDTRIDALSDAFRAAIDRAQAQAAIARTRRTVFLDDGRETEADVVTLGQVAGFAVAADGAGALLPAGGGALQVHGPSNPDEARAVLAGTPPEAVGLFLFESADKRADPPRAKTFDDTLRAGGAIGKVILGLGAVLVLLALWRVVAIVRGTGGSPADAEAVALALREQRHDDARRLAAGVRGAMGRVLARIVEAPERGREELEVVAEQAVEREANALDRFATPLLVGASVAPLLGLLGTVSGMIATFDVITEYGAGNPKLLSGGISEALVTTQLGLIVAIPGVLIGNLLASRAREIADAAESAAVLALHHIGRARLHVMAPHAGGDDAAHAKGQPARA